MRNATIIVSTVSNKDYGVTRLCEHYRSYLKFSVLVTKKKQFLLFFFSPHSIDSCQCSLRMMVYNNEIISPGTGGGNRLEETELPLVMTQGKGHLWSREMRSPVEELIKILRRGWTKPPRPPPLIIFIKSHRFFVVLPSFFPSTIPFLKCRFVCKIFFPQYFLVKRYSWNKF